MKELIQNTDKKLYTAISFERNFKEVSKEQALKDIDWACQSCVDKENESEIYICCYGAGDMF